MDVKHLLDNANVPLAFEHTNPDKKPQVTNKIVRFNGVNEDGHETFMVQINRKIQDYMREDGEKMAFNFCKTAQKPYDTYVVACLILAKIYFGNDFRISSDGNVSDWQVGINEVNRIFDYNVKMEGEEVENAKLTWGVTNEQ